MDLKTKRLFCAIVGLVSILTIVGTISYAFFTATTSVQNQYSDLSTSTVSVRFADYGNEVGGSLNFGESITKQFTIENTGTIDTSIRMSWVDLINTYTEGSLSYTLSYSENASGPFTEVISKTNVPRSQTPTKRTLASTLTIPVNKTYYYNLVITLNYLEDIDQNADFDAVFASKFSVEDINKKYQVSFDPNGGTVDIDSKTITENTEYGTLPIPTRENINYEFLGWFTEPEGGIQVTEETLVENNDNHTLYAHWGIDNTMMTWVNNKKIWAHGEDIKKIVFETTMEPKAGAVYTYDLSEKENGSVMTYLVRDTEDSTKYIAYIQSDGKIKANPNSSSLFRNFSNMESIEGFENIDMKNITNVSWMFSKCVNLISLDVSSIDTSKVTDMNHMFSNCNSLVSLDVSNFDTSNVTNMYAMFQHCNSLSFIDLRGFSTSNVTNMTNMFYNCQSLTSIDLNNFNTSNVNTLQSMFSNCTSLISLDVSKFNTEKVTNMSSMFSSCSALTTLDISNFDTSKVTNMDYMFQNCSSLTTLNISNFNVSSVTSKTNIFYSVLSSIKITVGNSTLRQWVIDASNSPKLTSSNIVIG